MNFTTIAALVVGFFTFLSLLVPLGLSPWVPVGLCAVATTLSLGDALFNQSRTTRYYLDLLQEISDPTYKQRLAYHESGHLLVGYLMGLRAIDYAVGVRESRQKGYFTSSLVEFDQPAQVSRRAYATTLMAGGVAEVLVYQEARGGADDLAQVQALLASHPQRDQQIRIYCRTATELLTQYRTFHEQLARRMLAGAPLAECIHLLATLPPVAE